MIITIKKDDKLWDLFSRKEEYNSIHLDEHHRFSYNFTNFKNIHQPEVSEFLVKNGFIFSWRDDKKFAVCLSHDIDDIYPTLKYRSFTSLKFALKSNFKLAMNRILKKENPYWNFKEIISLEKKADAVSSFYIMADESRYNPNDLSEELRYIIDKGCEVGLHGGYYSYDNVNRITAEKQRLENILGKKIIGYRSHFLRFKIPDTWILLSKVGFKYDSTLGYVDKVGFRNGMCHPFLPFNLNENKIINIIEIPLVIMDGTLFKKMRLNEKECWDVCKNLIDTVEKLNGVITFVWHNNSFDDIFFKNRRKLYIKILSYCTQKNAWMTNGEEVYAWTKKKLK